MREAFDVPVDDRFILVRQHDEQAFDCDPHYLGIERSADLVIVQIACRDSRNAAQKQAFGSLAAQPACGVDRVVGQDGVGAGALERSEGFEHHRLLVQPAVLRGGLEHRVLA